LLRQRKRARDSRSKTALRKRPLANGDQRRRRHA